MNMRKGFNLVEMLVVLVMIPVAAFTLDRFFNTVLLDFPRSSAVVQENKIVLSMLRQMQKDIDGAKDLPAATHPGEPESFAGHTAGGELLLIEQPEGVICYQLKEGQVLRRKSADNQDAMVWSVPNAEVQWQVWRKNAKGYAVEVQTHIKQKLRAKWQKKMANSHLYFIGIFEKI